MTNGEKIKEIFPNAEYLECEVVMDVVFARNQENWFDLEWWNAEYIEPTQKIKVLDRNEAMRKLGTVDVYQARAWVTLLDDLEYLGLKICEVEE